MLALRLTAGCPELEGVALISRPSIWGTIVGELDLAIGAQT